MGELLEEILRTGTVRAPDGREFPLHSHISPEEGALLQRIIREVRPKVGLEIGLAYGVSALYICETLQDVGADVHIILDPLQDEDWHGVGLHNLTRSGFADLVRFEASPSVRALPMLVDEGVGVDLAFVDGWHTFDVTLLEFFYIDLLLRPGGIVAFDDAALPSIRKMLRFVLTNRAYSVYAALPPTVAPGHALARRALRRTLRGLGRSSNSCRRIISPRFVVTDEELGLEPGARFIALRKDGPDERFWDFHRDF